MNPPSASLHRQSWAAFLTWLAGVLAVGFAAGWWLGARGGLVPVPCPGVRAPAATAAPRQVARGEEPVGSFDDEVADTARLPYDRRWRLARAAAQMDRADVVAALDREARRLATVRSGDFNFNRDRPPTEALLGRLAELDLPAAAAFLLQLREQGRSGDSAWDDVVLATWIARDPEGAVAWVHGLADGRFRRSFQEELPLLLVERAPQLAVREFATSGVSDPAAAETFFTQLAVRDLPLAQAQVFASPGVSEVAVYGVVYGWMETGRPPEVYAWVSQILKSRVRMQALMAFYGAWGSRDPAAAAVWMTARGGPDLEESNAEAVVTQWAVRDLPAALAWCGQLPAAARDYVTPKVLGIWEEADPRAAAQYMGNLPKVDGLETLAGATQEWAKSDREGARAWTESLPPGEVSQEAQQGISQALYADDPAAALTYLNALPDAAAHREQMESFVTDWARTDPVGVWQYSQSLADPGAAAAAAAVALGQMATADPTRAAALFAGLPADAQEKAAGGLAENWAGDDPEAAARWAATLPEGPPRTAAWAALVKRWGSDDAPAAATWLADQPSGEERDPGLTRLLQTRAGDLDPHDAVRLARSVASDDQRGEALQAVAASWLKRDRPAATAWIKRARDLTDDQRANLLAVPDEASPVSSAVVTP